MADLDLANALAQQAAGRQGRRGGAAAAVPPARAGGWQVPRLARDFRLDDATRTAVAKVAGVMNRSLRAEGLVVSPPQEAGELPVVVAEKGGGKVLKAYDTAEFLTVFAHQRQQAGVIVDGQV
jgi:hypothetical protein